MRRFVFLLIICMNVPAAFGQLIKKEKEQSAASPLDRIAVSEHFSSDDLPYVFRVLKENYGVTVKYDSALCARYVFSYWFTATPMSRALEIILRDKPLTWKLESENTVRVFSSQTINSSFNNAPIEAPAEAEKTAAPSLPKYTGAPKAFHIALSGKVTDLVTGEALPSAVIRVVAGTDGTVTNADGVYSLPDVPTDTNTLSVSYLGYQQKLVYLQPGDNFKYFNIELQPETHVLQQAVVKGTKETLVRLSGEKISVVKLSPQKLAELPNIGEKDIMRAFQLMPGVSAANESSSGLYVRGGTPDQNHVLYDGFTIYQVDHLYGFFSAFNANALKEVQLYKGGFESKFGGRLSSVTEITGKDGNQKNFNMGGELSLLSANAWVEVPITDNITFLAAGRRSWRGPIYNWIFDNFNKTSSSNSGGGNRGGGGLPGSEAVKAKSNFYDANMKLTMHPSKKDVISLSYFSGKDNLDNGYSISTPSFLASQGISFDFGTVDLTRYGNVGAGAKWGRKWNEKLYSTTLISYSNYFSTRERSTTGTITEAGGASNTFSNGLSEDNNLKDKSFKTDFEWKLFKGHNIGFGLFGTTYDIDYTYNQNDTTSVLDRHNLGQIVGGYLQDNIRLFDDKLEITPGIRVTQYDVTGKNYNEPRLSAQYKFARNFAGKGAWGEYYQFANRITREDILSGSRDFWILSDDKKVPVSHAVHYIGGLSYENNNVLFSAEGYYKTLDKLSQYSLRYQVNQQGINYSENFFNGTGYSQGIELLAQKKWGKLTGWVSYTLGKTRYHFDVYSDHDFYADQDVRHEFKIAGVYKYKRWDFSGTWIFASGRPYTAPSGAYTIKLLDGTSESYYTVTEKNALRLPDYHRLDLSANYHIYSEFGRDIGYIGFSIFNAYARANVWYKQYQIVDNQVVETNVNYLGLIPNLTLSLKLR